MVLRGRPRCHVRLGVDALQDGALIGGVKGIGIGVYICNVLAWPHSYRAISAHKLNSTVE